jgi:hypothetical protein
MKTEVYSWRLSTDTKTRLEREARRRRISLAAVLDLAAEEWLKTNASGNDNDAEQRRLQRAALKCFGSLASGDTLRSENAGNTVRRRLQRRYGR